MPPRRRPQPVEESSSAESSSNDSLSSSTSTEPSPVKPRPAKSRAAPAKKVQQKKKASQSSEDENVQSPQRIRNSDSSNPVCSLFDEVQDSDKLNSRCISELMQLVATRRNQTIQSIRDCIRLVFATKPNVYTARSIAFIAAVSTAANGQSLDDALLEDVCAFVLFCFGGIVLIHSFDPQDFYRSSRCKD